MPIKTLVLTHFNQNLCIEIYDDYYHAINKNFDDVEFIDYRRLYLELGKSGFEGYVLDAIASNKIDVVFFMPYSEDLTLELFFLKEISEQTKLIINFFDTEYFFEQCDRYYAQTADLVVLPDSQAMCAYSMYGLNALCSYSLFDVQKYRRKTDAVKDIDVLFIGDMQKSGRQEYVSYLIANGIKVELYGKNTLNGVVDFEAMADLFNRAKISLNFASYDLKAYLSANINKRIKQSKGRPIEVALCGGFCLSELTPSIGDMFEVGVEIDVFETQDELLSKVRYYLQNEEAREVIAKNGTKRALRDYDVDKALPKIIKDLAVQKKRNIDTLYSDKAFFSAFLGFRFYYLMLALLNFKTITFWEELLILLKNPRFYYSGGFYYSYRGFLEYLNKFPDFKKNLKKLILWRGKNQ